jgi:hypothetical protein
MEIMQIRFWGVKRGIVKLEAVTQSLKGVLKETVTKFTRRSLENISKGLILNGCNGKY